MSVTAFMAVLEREWRVPPNMRLKFEREGGSVVIFVTGVWDAVDPDDPVATNSKVMTHTCRHLPFEMLEHWETGKMIEYARQQVYEAVRELWMHELHEWVTHYGEHIVHPHPDGRDSFR